MPADDLFILRIKGLLGQHTETAQKIHSRHKETILIFLFPRRAKKMPILLILESLLHKGVDIIWRIDIPPVCRNIFHLHTPTGNKRSAACGIKVHQYGSRTMIDHIHHPVTLFLRTHPIFLCKRSILLCRLHRKSVPAIFRVTCTGITP